MGRDRVHRVVVQVPKRHLACIVVGTAYQDEVGDHLETIDWGAEVLLADRVQGVIGSID